MTVTVLLFASYADALGQNQIELDVCFPVPRGTRPVRPELGFEDGRGMILEELLLLGSDFKIDCLSVRHML